MKKFFTNWWVVSGLIVLILLGIFIFGLPIFVAFMRALWVKILFGVLILGVWGLLAFLRARKAKKAADAISAELLAPSATDEESAALKTRMAEALNSLKTAAGKKRDYLYTRPWYVVIGPPGAGKTTALVNSGLRFPFSEQSFKGLGGTRNLDFWFADEAVLVDTAGRYTTQDSDQSVDSQGWKSFLALLKKHRPLQPINGILIAIGADELLSADRAQIDAHASAVRRRLMELRASLEVAAPAYLLITKADLLAGFVEYFDDLDVEGRRAVLGSTLPYAAGKPDSNSVILAFDEMVRAVSDRQAKRLFEDIDQTRRSLVMGFPAQLGSLRARVARFIEGAFVAGDQPGATLRGFYLTSGVQEGAPLDRILSGMADVYDQPVQASGSSGKTYFLNRLLTEVIFDEAGLVQMDPAARRRQRSRFVGAMAGVGAVAALTLLAWGYSFFANRSFQSELAASAQQVQTLTRESGVDMVEVRGTDPDLEQSLNILRSLRNLPQGYAARAAGQPGIMMRFGLYQTSHSDAAVEAYHDGLRRILLPRLLLRLEQYMAENGSSALALYEPLKVYLMLGGQGPLDPGAVKSWAQADWSGQSLPGSDRSQVRAELGQHLSALLEDPNMAAAWSGRKTPLDGTTIASARAAIQTLSMAERAYAIMRQKALSSGGASWVAANVMPPGDAQAFAGGEKLREIQIPFFYTRKGFEALYLVGLASAQQDLKKELWVMGGDANTVGVQEQLGSIRPGIANLYAQEYIASWNNVISAMQPAAYFSDPAAFGAFTKAPSPLKVMLLQLRENTTFQGGTAAGKKLLGQAIENKMGRARTMLPGGQGSTTFDAGVEIANHFKPVHDYVGDGKTPAPIDDFLNAMKAAGVAVQSAKMAVPGTGGDAVQSQVAMAMGAVQAASAGAPTQLQPFVSAATSGGAKAQVSSAQGAISDAYAQSVLPDCKLAVQDRYPFFGAATEDASMVDVQRVFGMNGVVEGFFTQRVMPLLDTAGPVWRWKSDSQVAMTLDPASPDEFAKARQVRDLLVAGLAMKIEVQSMGGGLTAVEFGSGGTTYKFDPANTGARPIIWSAQGSLPQAYVALFKGPTQIAKVEAQGPWALFRLMDKARRENSGAQTILATFGEGANSVVFRISLPNDRNPFSRGGLWSFRCPTTL